MLQAKVKCPRCGKVWIIPNAHEGGYCTCHLFCSSGDKPSDCAMTYPVNYSGSAKWPEGMHVDAEDEGDDVMHRCGYCSTHKKYTYKEPIWLEVDWKNWWSQRAPKEFREVQP